MFVDLWLAYCFCQIFGNRLLKYSAELKFVCLILKTLITFLRVLAY
jgi:hypothetical protein